MKPEIQLYNAEQSRRLDFIAVEKYGFSGSGLMRRAGEQAFAAIVGEYGFPESMTVLCGPGNNGGDGYVVSSCALKAGIECRVIQLGEPRSDSSREMFTEFTNLGGQTVSPDQTDSIEHSDLIVDGIFGTGLSRPPDGKIRGVINAANAAGCPIVALDCPSGVNTDTGHAFDPCIQANLTVTFIGKKIGLHTGMGTQACGSLVYVGLGIPDKVHREVQSEGVLLDTPFLEPRKPSSHKGNYGHVFVAGGCNGMLGAALMAGTSALRTGSGLVTVLSTEQHLDLPALNQPELMSMAFPGDISTVRDRCDVMVLGPGLGTSEWSKSLFDIVMAMEAPKVIDADGLNLLAAHGGECSGCVLTPHPGEAARLLNIDTREVQSNRIQAARDIAKKYCGICVLKGNGTVIADEQGNIWVCDKGNPGMASAGMGDVLSGVVGSLLGMGNTPKDSACIGVWLHSVAADRTAEALGQHSMVASDVIQRLPEIVKSVSGKA